MTAGRPDAALVVLNLNGRRHLPALLAHLAVQTVRSFELVFIDNGSHDGSAELVEQGCAAYGLRLTLVRNATNRGFAPACNQGIVAADPTAPAIVMLNNDTRPEPAWLEHLLATADDGQRVGMVASKMLRAHRPDQIDSAGIAIDWAGIAWDRDGGAQDEPSEHRPVEVFGPCGGAALYTRALLDDVGGFDPAFFAYLEDVDLAWRARLRGWRCLLAPQARILHAHSATLGDASPFKRYLLGRNKMWLLAKNLPDADLVRHGPAMLGYDALATGYGVATRGDFAAARGRLAGLAGLPALWPKRQAVQGSILDADNWRRCMLPTVPPWQVPQRYAHLEAAG